MNLQIELKNVGEELDLVKNEMDAGVSGQGFHKGLRLLSGI